MKVNDFKDMLKQMHANLDGCYDFTPDNVYQPGNAANREIIGKLMDSLMEPESRIDNAQALQKLYEKCRQGESCLILAEHYSNFDYPVIFRLVEKTPGLGKDVAESMLPIRGMKLSESTHVTAAFSHSFDTIVIYPSRTLDAISDPEKLAEARKVSLPINHAAIKEMIEHKHHGRIIMVFPSGTRYRSWVPDSRKGVREIHSYLKTFDNVVFIAINGNTLPPNRSEDMTKDETVRDLMVLTCSDIISGRDYRKQKETTAPEGADPRQHVVDCVMNDLLSLHNKVEPLRLKEKAERHSNQ